MIKSIVTIPTCNQVNGLQTSSRQNIPILKQLLVETLEPLSDTAKYKELRAFFSNASIPETNEPFEKTLSFHSGPYTIAFNYEHKTQYTLKGKLEIEHKERLSVYIYAKDRSLIQEEQNLIKRYNFEFVDNNRGIVADALVKASDIDLNGLNGMKVEFVYVTGSNQEDIAYPIHGGLSLNNLSEDIIQLSFSSPPILSSLGKERIDRWMRTLDRMYK